MMQNKLINRVLFMLFLIYEFNDNYVSGGLDSINLVVPTWGDPMLIC